MSQSDYSKLNAAYNDNTRINCPKESFTQPSDKDRFAFYTFIYKNDPSVWTDCGAGMQHNITLKRDFFPLSAVEMINQLGITNVMVKETPTTLFMVRLCPSGSILILPSSNIMNPTDKMMDSDGNILPFTKTDFWWVSQKTKKSVAEKLINYLNSLKNWSSCNTTDMFQQFVSSLEIDQKTDFSKITGFMFDKTNRNPHIIQLIDLCRDTLRYKYQISYNAVNKKVVFHSLCRKNIEKNLFSNVV